MLDGVVVRHKIDPVVESQPEVLVPVQVEPEDIVVLQPFFPGEILDDFSLPVHYINAAEVGSDGQPVFIDWDAGENALIYEGVMSAEMKGCNIVLVQNVKSGVDGADENAVCAQRENAGDKVAGRKGSMFQERGPDSVFEFKHPVPAFLGNQPAVTFSEKEPVRRCRVYGNGLAGPLKYLFPAHEKDIIAKGNNKPDIGKTGVFPRQERFQGKITQPPSVLGEKITELILSAHIDPVVLSDSDRSDHGLVRKRMQLPVNPVKTQEAFVIRKIHDPVPVFSNTPVLGSGIIYILCVADNIRNPDRSLCITAG
jgi:hypothetical protein